MGASPDAVGVARLPRCVAGPLAVRFPLPTSRRKFWSLALALAFLVALVMGPGPGITLANRPEAVLGIPALYLWGLTWYAVEVGLVVAAYWLVWRHDADDVDTR